MQQIFIELFNYRDRWKTLSVPERETFAQGVLGAVNHMRTEGVEVIGWGFNDPNTDYRAPYDLYCVYKTPSAEYQRGFERAIAQSGWHDLFEQVNVSGAVLTPDDLLAACVRLEAPKATT